MRRNVVLPQPLGPTTAMNSPDMKAKFAQQGMFPDDACGAKFGTFLRNITADYEKVTTAAGIKAN